MVLLALTGGFMVSSFLSFAATNAFEIYFYGCGPTELRLVFIFLNTTIIYSGAEHFVWSVPATCAVCAVALAVVVWRAHRMLWEIDMQAKKQAI